MSNPQEGKCDGVRKIIYFMGSSIKKIYLVLNLQNNKSGIQLILYFIKEKVSHSAKNLQSPPNMTKGVVRKIHFYARLYIQIVTL